MQLISAAKKAALEFDQMKLDLLTAKKRNHELEAIIKQMHPNPNNGMIRFIQFLFLLYLLIQKFNRPKKMSLISKTFFFNWKKK